jgi:hypothetical protein
VIPATQEIISRRVAVAGQPQAKIFETLSEKLPKAKWTGGMAQVVEFSKCKALSSNWSTTKKKKKKEEMQASSSLPSED